MRNHYRPWFRSTVRVLPPPRVVPAVAFQDAWNDMVRRMNEYREEWLKFYGGLATLYGFAEIRCEKPGYNCTVKTE